MRKNLSGSFTALAVMLVLTAITVSPAWANDVYVQATDNGGSYASQNDTSGGLGNYATSYDNFNLTTTTLITSVDWVGTYFPFPGTTTGFTVNFYADSGGAPGALLYSTGDVAGDAGETLLGTDSLGDPTYAYSLSTDFVASDVTTYWLSITADSAFPPQWGWETGTGGDGAAYQCFFGSCGATANDLAFGLSVPEPSTALLMPSSLGLLGIIFRKKLGWRR
jgi:hypothetical protein